MAVVVLAMLLAAPMAASGQLLEGAKVRARISGKLADDGSVTPGDGTHAIVARFVGMEPDRLILAMGSSAKTVSLPKASVRTLEISRGPSRLKGALIGAGVGLAVGMVWGK